MFKYFFKRILPTPEWIRGNRFLRPLIHKVTHSTIWQVNRHNISLSVAIGLFFGALPMPMQMAAAGAFAIFLRANLPAALMLTWWSNPFTFAPIFYFNYRVGAYIYDFWFGLPPQKLVIEHFNTEMLRQLSGQVLLPLFAGSIFVGLIFAICGYGLTLWSWRLSLIWHHIQRKARKKTPCSNHKKE